MRFFFLPPHPQRLHFHVPQYIVSNNHISSCQYSPTKAFLKYLNANVCEYVYALYMHMCDMSFQTLSHQTSDVSSLAEVSSPYIIAL